MQRSIQKQRQTIRWCTCEDRTWTLNFHSKKFPTSPTPGMPENRRTPQDALVTTAGHPGDQYERLETILSKCFHVYLSLV